MEDGGGGSPDEEAPDVGDLDVARIPLHGAHAQVRLRSLQCPRQKIHQTCSPVVGKGAGLVRSARRTR